jgi:hypothetical protein
LKVKIIEYDNLYNNSKKYGVKIIEVLKWKWKRIIFIVF